MTRFRRSDGEAGRGRGLVPRKPKLFSHLFKVDCLFTERLINGRDKMLNPLANMPREYRVEGRQGFC